MREEKTGEVSTADGEEIIQYFTSSKLKDNCHIFIKYGIASIDEIDNLK